jgi:phosphatidylserine/phosphatidylglycerophosphate/cardiolipin synthase-like enzyme
VISLRSISTPDLERLASLVRTGTVEAPLSAAALAAEALGHMLERSPELGRLDLGALSAVLEAVLSERRSPGHPRLELVWTGPEAAAAGGRDTAVVVRELFHSARQTVLVAGFAFDHGRDLLSPLHQAMHERAVRATLCLNLEESEPIDAQAAGFLEANWPFGPPYPSLFADARARDPQAPRASLHAKCIVVDDERALITSANFTRRGQSRNFEAGVLVHDLRFATLLSRQWTGAIGSGLLFELQVPAP